MQINYDYGIIFQNYLNYKLEKSHTLACCNTNEEYWMLSWNVRTFQERGKNSLDL